MTLPRLRAWGLSDDEAASVLASVTLPWLRAWGLSDDEAASVLILVSPLARVLHDAGLKRAIKVGAVSELALQPAQVLMRGCGRRGPTATATHR